MAATTTASRYHVFRADPSSRSWPDYEYLTTLAEVRDAQDNRLAREELSTLFGNHRKTS